MRLFLLLLPVYVYEIRVRATLLICNVQFFHGFSKGFFILSFHVSATRENTEHLQNFCKKLSILSKDTINYSGKFYTLIALHLSFIIFASQSFYFLQFG